MYNFNFDANSYVYIDNSNWDKWYQWIYQCLMNGHDSASHSINGITIMFPMRDIPGIAGDHLVGIFVQTPYELNKLFEKLFGENFLDKVKETYSKQCDEYKDHYIKWSQLCSYDIDLSNKKLEELRKLCWECKPYITDIH